jgi:hypothetical protein
LNTAGKHKIWIAVAAVLFVAGLAGGGYLRYKEGQSNRPMERAPAADKDMLSVYYPVGAGKLARKPVYVPRQVIDRSKGELLFRELKAARCIPDRLKLHELAMGSDGVLYLNVSREFIDRDTERDITMVYGIVNSFLETFKNMKSVQLLVEGQPVYTRSGIVYIFEPLAFNKELLED